MFKYRVLYLLIMILFSKSLFSQEHFLVYFTDKKGTTFDPYSYFDQKAIERRIHHGISLFDESDFPLNNEYVSDVENLSDEIFFTSRWFNCIGIISDNQRVEFIENLPFVSNVEKLFSSKAQLANSKAQLANSKTQLADIEESKFSTKLSEEDKAILLGQLDVLGVETWKSNNIDGSGIRIAIFDGGFTGSENNPFFQHIYKSGRVKGTKDFTSRKKGQDVYYGGTHGTSVWSCIAGKNDTIQTGLAIGAEFLLAKTEKKSEFFKEELNWAEAAEWADKNGADIINSSLGYTHHRYFNFEMNGKKSFVAKAANMAARKGMLVVNAAGNEGNSKWLYIGTPADADSVLSVGGISPGTGYHASFSSYGPTSDKRMKPNVVAYGDAIAATPNALSNVSGTSFASPLIAGFAACAKQKMPNLTNMQLFKEIEKSGNTYPYFDFAHGFGIPQADYFYKNTKNDNQIPTLNVIENEDYIKVVIDSNVVSLDSLKYIKLLYSNIYINDNENFAYNSDKLKNEPYLYYNFMDENMNIQNYNVVYVYNYEVLEFEKEFLEGYKYLNVFYKGYFIRYEIKN